MSYLVLARKYRPHTFAEMVGQEHVVQALSNALHTRRLHHAWLFTGTRGVGKTTVSRILAKSLNCTGADGQGGITATPCGVCPSCVEIDAGRFVDYTELDAASNRGVDEIQALLEQAIYKPVQGRFKVFMIDEVHMLTNTAFNAMLKTLEEPPEYLKFVLATTDPQKVPITVLSRCLQFNLRPMPPEVIAAHLQHVLQREGMDADSDALHLLARAAQGSMRDALSLTDQAIAWSTGAQGTPVLQGAAIRQMLGSVDSQHIHALLHALAQGQAQQVVELVRALQTSGQSATHALQEMVRALQRMAVWQLAPGAMPQGDLPPDEADIRRLAATLPADETQLLYSLCLHGQQELGLAPDEYAALLMVLLRLFAFKPTAPGSVNHPPGNAGHVGGHAGEVGHTHHAARADGADRADSLNGTNSAGSANSVGSAVHHPATGAHHTVATTAEANADTAAHAKVAAVAEVAADHALAPSTHEHEHEHEHADAQAGQAHAAHSQHQPHPSHQADRPSPPPTPPMPERPSDGASGVSGRAGAGSEGDDAADHDASANPTPPDATQTHAGAQASALHPAEANTLPKPANSPSIGQPAPAEPTKSAEPLAPAAPPPASAQPLAAPSPASAPNHIAQAESPPPTTLNAPPEPLSAQPSAHTAVADARVSQPATASPEQAASADAPAHASAQVPAKVPTQVSAATQRPGRPLSAPAAEEPPPWEDWPPSAPPAQWEQQESVPVSTPALSVPFPPFPDGEGEALALPVIAMRDPVHTPTPPPHSPPHAPDQAADASQAPRRFIPTELGDVWCQLALRMLEQFTPTGLVRELLLQTQLLAQTPGSDGGADVWTLRLEKEVLNHEPNRKKLEQILGQMGYRVILAIEYGHVLDTPALRQQQQRYQQHQQRQMTFAQHPAIQGLVQQLGARLLPDSIRLAGHMANHSAAAPAT